MIFPFSEDWPANYNFSLSSKLATNYPKNKNIFKKQPIFPQIQGFSQNIFDCFFNIFSGIFGPRGGCASSRLDHGLKTQPGRLR